MKITADPHAVAQAVLADVDAIAETLRFAAEVRKATAEILGSTSVAVDSMLAVAALWFAGRMEGGENDD